MKKMDSEKAPPELVKKIRDLLVNKELNPGLIRSRLIVVDKANDKDIDAAFKEIERSHTGRVRQIRNLLQKEKPEMIIKILNTHTDASENEINTAFQDVDRFYADLVSRIRSLLPTTEPGMIKKILNTHTDAKDFEIQKAFQSVDDLSMKIKSKFPNFPLDIHGTFDYSSLHLGDQVELFTLLVNQQVDKPSQEIEKHMNSMEQHFIDIYRFDSDADGAKLKDLLNKNITEYSLNSSENVFKSNKCYSNLIGKMVSSCESKADVLKDQVSQGNIKNTERFIKNNMGCFKNNAVSLMPQVILSGPAMLKIFLKNCGNEGALSDFGKECLIAACKARNMEVIEFLLKENIKIDDYTPVINAATAAKHTVILQILDHRGVLGKKDNDWSQWIPKITEIGKKNKLDKNITTMNKQPFLEEILKYTRLTVGN